MTRTVDSNPDAERACADLADWMDRNRTSLRDILQLIESRETVNDEIFKSIDALRNVSQEGITRFMPFGDGAALFPINLPLYSLVIFGIIPGIFASRMFIRTPMVTRETIRKIAAALPSTPLTDRLVLCNCNRSTFMDDYVNRSAFILFTGTLKNANVVRKKIRKDQLLIFNGQGINPIVIGADAEMELAVAKTYEVKRFNSGQDCAAADSIFIHTDLYEDFIQLLIRRLDELRIGSYFDGAEIGPLTNPAQVFMASEHLFRWRHAITYGGVVDLKRGLVMPTVVECPSVSQANMRELFSPIWHVCRYENDDDLCAYFEHPSYREYAMYVSLFGSNLYIQRQKHTVVIQDKIIMDVERGNKEYGGYSIGSSFVQHAGTTTSRPILISRELKRAFLPSMEHANATECRNGTVRQA